MVFHNQDYRPIHVFPEVASKATFGRAPPAPASQTHVLFMHYSQELLFSLPLLLSQSRRSLVKGREEREKKAHVNSCEQCMCKPEPVEARKRDLRCCYILLILASMHVRSSCLLLPSSIEYSSYLIHG
jgi:hypothetical protein